MQSFLYVKREITDTNQKGEKDMSKRLVFVLLFTMSIFITLSASVDATNNRYSWGYQMSKNEQPPYAGPKLEELLVKTGAYYRDVTEEKVLYLTFDNGYENGFTNQILDVLQKTKVPAAFFVTGHYLNSAPELVERMVKEGHIVGNHSWSHPDMTEISDAQIQEELAKVQKKFEELTGVKEMNYLRPPKGVFSQRTIEVTNKLGYTHIFWSIAFLDWKPEAQKGWKYSYDKTMSQLHPGAIILLHSISKDNAEALEKIITDARARGYEFQSLDYFIQKKVVPPTILD